MTLHPEIAEILAGIPEPDGSPLDPVAMRAGEAAQVPPLEERLPIRSVDDLELETPAGTVPVRVYADVEGPAGVLVYVHGGAFFLGSLDTHDHVCRFLAQETQLRVVSVGYRLAPEHTGTAGLDDCYAVVETVAAQGVGGEMGWDGGILAVAGDSSGGTIAAAVAAKAHDAGLPITHQVLYYPSLDLDFENAIADKRYASLEENATGYGLETGGLIPFNSFYLAGVDAADPLVSPLRRDDLTGLPAALVVTAQYDPLRDEGELYARRLEEAGVRVEHVRFGDVNHGFVQNFSWLPEVRRVYPLTAAFLRG